MNEAKKPKRIDMTKPSFVANGKEYFITSHLTVARFCEFQILEKEVGFSMNFDKVFQEINEITELMNETKFVECAVRLETLHFIRKYGKRRPFNLEQRRYDRKN